MLVRKRGCARRSASHWYNLSLKEYKSQKHSQKQQQHVKIAEKDLSSAVLFCHGQAKCVALTNVLVLKMPSGDGAKETESIYHFIPLMQL